MWSDVDTVAPVNEDHSALKNQGASHAIWRLSTKRPGTCTGRNVGHETVFYFHPRVRRVGTIHKWAGSNRPTRPPHTDRQTPIRIYDAQISSVA